MENSDPKQWLEDNQLGAEEKRVLRRMFTAAGRYPHALMYKESPEPQISSGGEVVVEGLAARYALERLGNLGLVNPPKDGTVVGLYTLTEWGAQVAGIMEFTEGC